jgi:hypothetical protein
MARNAMQKRKIKTKEIIMLFFLRRIYGANTERNGQT